MRGLGSRRTWLLARVTVYVTIILVLFTLRGGEKLSSLFSRLSPFRDGDDLELTLAGGDLAPELIGRLVDAYQRDYPNAETRVLPGGTNHALEDLLYERIDAAFLSRPPDEREQELFLAAHGDSLLAFPIALGAIVVLHAPDGSPTTLRPSDLAAIARGRDVEGVTRLYVPDPNSGLWNAFTAALGIGEEESVPGVVFLEDDDEVSRATARDPGAVGVVSDLTAADVAGATLRVVPLRGEGHEEASPPSHDAVAAGEYPLTHYLYVSCRANGPRAASKFVTHAIGRRGQRQVERAGYLPARHVARAVVLTREPL